MRLRFASSSSGETTLRGDSLPPSEPTPLKLRVVLTKLRINCLVGSLTSMLHTSERLSDMQLVEKVAVAAPQSGPASNINPECRKADSRFYCAPSYLHFNQHRRASDT